MTFSDDLRAAADASWDEATRHRFVDEVWDGQLEPAVLAEFVVQDAALLDQVLALLGNTVAIAGRPGSRLTLARRTGQVADRISGYLTHAMDALDVPLEDRRDPQLRPATRELCALIGRIRLTADRPGGLALLLGLDWPDLERADRAGAEAPTDPLQREWIELRRGPAAEAWVSFLRLELDRTAAGAGSGEQQRLTELFTRAVQLQADRLAAAYA